MAASSSLIWVRKTPSTRIRARAARIFSALVVPLIDAQNLLLVREYAVGLERYELGFVKGRIDSGEGPHGAAQREMQEETGFAARELVQLASVALTPAYSKYRTFLFLAPSFPNYFNVPSIVN